MKDIYTLSERIENIAYPRNYAPFTITENASARGGKYIAFRFWSDTAGTTSYANFIMISNHAFTLHRITFDSNNKVGASSFGTILAKTESVYDRDCFKTYIVDDGCSYVLAFSNKFFQLLLIGFIYGKVGIERITTNSEYTPPEEPTT